MAEKREKYVSELNDPDTSRVCRKSKKMQEYKFWHAEEDWEAFRSVQKYGFHVSSWWVWEEKVVSEGELVRIE